MGKPSIVKQVEWELKKQIRFGESKHEAKQRAREQALKEGKTWNPARVEGIYSIQTLKDYLKKGVNFAKWARDTHGAKTLEQAKAYVPEFLEQYDNPWTRRCYASALSKLYHCSSTDWDVQFEVRSKDKITKSRKKAVRDRNFSKERNKDLVDFCKGTGLRRKELLELRPDDIYEKDGQVFVFVREGKGGRKRNVHVLKGYEKVVLSAKRRALKEGRDKVFPKVHTDADIHALRREYAQARYREVSNFRTRNLYRTKDGHVYDRDALGIVSQDLGHSRLDVVVKHYLS